ncbi:MAG TPA: hypothetical protein VLW75_05140 [Rhizomicrobium sp.]|nr:hypothetical protein [Rhizomicrobium sp.]
MPDLRMHRAGEDRRFSILRSVLDRLRPLFTNGFQKTQRFGPEFLHAVGPAEKIIRARVMMDIALGVSAFGRHHHPANGIADFFLHPASYPRIIAVFKMPPACAHIMWRDVFRPSRRSPVATGLPLARGDQGKAGADQRVMGGSFFPKQNKGLPDFAGALARYPIVGM